MQDPGLTFGNFKIFLVIVCPNFVLMFLILKAFFPYIPLDSCLFICQKSSFDNWVGDVQLLGNTKGGPCCWISLYRRVKALLSKSWL